jgi:DNA-binding transcriptional MocR family regulator
MPRLSARLKDLHGSPVRAMLEASLRPGVISFAGGLPAPESFEDIALPAPPRSLLQYGPTEGEPELRARIASELRAIGLDCSAERVLVLSGSQQGIDLVAKLCIDAGTEVAAESPAYLAALQVFRFFGAEVKTIAPDTWTPDAAPALAYVTPTFQNPTGRCWTLEERMALAEACAAWEVVLFEDDPYRELVYEPCERRPVASFMTGGSWVYQGSFSKVLAPGLRLGFLAASEDLYEPLYRLKQAADLHTSRTGQWAALHYLEDPGRPERLRRLAEGYRLRRDRFAEALQRHLGGVAAWDVPPGGLFFWVRLAPGVDPDRLLARAAERGVLFTPGRHFLADPTGAAPAMRLNFSNASEEEAERGLAILGGLLREAADQGAAHAA